MNTQMQNELAKAEKDKRSENRRITAENDFRTIMSSAFGRRFMAELLDLTGVFRCTFTGDETTYFREGARNVGLFYMNRLNDLCPEHYQTMLKEIKENA